MLYLFIYIENLLVVMLKMPESPIRKCCTPDVAYEKKFKVKQEFKSIEEVFSFYNAYARECGFSARMSNSKKRKRNK